MHELSIAQSIIESVLKEIEHRQIPALRKIVLRVGALSGVCTEALRFGFETLSQDTRLAGAYLEIQEVPIHACCKSCTKEFDVVHYELTCPFCTSTEIEVSGGLDMDIAYLEVDDGRIKHG
jgi:hydrogenase nickel incorporation protein HypA/HybF